ncbi:hypothetical protein [Alcanivorax quisquiliarum]|uniref:Transposase, IS5 family n=1 Tax=Alcanivorax quisquiliarum TaxID=2933565 RepID=A0ABT0E7V8_9GAMM|nr:hypothetical protein [Alcanivorax quisquiliarum]MCK0537922.1 hypothetical protein [Alcanivorax quisquiliarum]
MLERHKLDQKLFHTINSHLDRHDLVLHEGSIVDASIIAIRGSTKNEDGKRDLETHQIKEGDE